jgi:hypothetical protein
VPYWVGAFALAWVIPLVAYLIGVAFVVPVLVVVGVMSLQRGASGFFDRLVMSIAQLIGAVCVAGLLFSVWPWHLHPVAMGGFALTVLVAIAAATGRRPQLPRRWRSRDSVLAVVFGVLLVLTYEPFVLRDLGGRLGIFMPGEDFSRHYLIFDMIGALGGYAFMSPNDTARFMPDQLDQGIRNYPQGAHFIYAVLDRFIRSADHNADGVTMINVLVWLHIAMFAFFGLAMLWTARRIAGAGVRPVQLLPVLGLVGAWLYFGDPITIFVRGFPNQLMGITLCAILTGIVARPLTHRVEQIVAVALLLIGISFNYHLYLPYALAISAFWAWRVRLWRNPLAYLAAVLMAGPLAVTPFLNLYATTGYQLTRPGTAETNDRPAAFVIFALAVLAIAAGRRGLRSPTRRANAIALGVALGIVVVLGTYQIVRLGGVIYYFEKTLHLLLIVGLVSLGGLARLLPRGNPQHRFLRQAVPGVAFILPLILFIGVAGGKHHTIKFHSPGLRLALGWYIGSPDGARDAILMTNMYPEAGGAINVDLMKTPFRNWYATVYASTMQRNYRYGHDWYLWHGVPQFEGWTIEDFEEMVEKSPVKVRLFVFDPAASFLVIHKNHPELRIQSDVRGPSYGETGAMTNIEAAEFLKKKYPDKVEVVYAVPPDR